MLLLFGVCYRCVAIRRRVLRVAIDGVKTGSGVASATEQLVHSKSVAKKLQKIEKTLNIGERSSFKRELKGLGGALRKAMRSVGEHTPTGANKGAVVSSRAPELAQGCCSFTSRARVRAAWAFTRVRWPQAVRLSLTAASGPGEISLAFVVCHLTASPRPTIPNCQRLRNEWIP